MPPIRRPTLIVIIAEITSRDSLQKHMHLFETANKETNCTSVKEDVLMLVHGQKNGEDAFAALPLELKPTSVMHFFNLDDRHVFHLVDPGDDATWSMTIDAIISEHRKDREAVIFSLSGVHGPARQYNGNHRQVLVDPPPYFSSHAN